MNSFKNNCFFLILIIINGSCSNITGLYYNKDFNKNTPDYAYISLCEDSIYYSVHNDIAGSGTFSGTWKRNDDTLILDIPAPWKAKKSFLIEKKNTKNDYVKFQCKILQSSGDTLNSIFIDTLIINEYIRLPLNSEGKANSDIKQVHKIEYKGIMLFNDRKKYSQIFYPKDSTSKHFELFIGQTDDIQPTIYSAFVWKKFLINGRKLHGIYYEDGRVKVVKFAYRRHGKCRKPN